MRTLPRTNARTLAALLPLLLAAPIALARSTAPSTAPSSAPTVASTTLLNLDRQEAGAARVDRLPDGRLVLTVTGARTFASRGTRVLLSTLAAPVKAGDKATLRAPYLAVGELTRAEQSFALPRNVRLSDYKTVVVWCAGAGLPMGGGALAFPDAR